MATAFRFRLHQDLVIVQPVVLPARAKADCPASFLRRAMETDSRRVVAAVSFAVRFSPETGGFAAAVVVAAAVAAVDLSDLSAAGLSVVAAGPGSVGFAVFAADLSCPACSFAVALGKGMVVVAVPFCFSTHRSSF